MKTKIILLIIVFCMAYLLTKAQDITGSGTTNYIPKFTNTTIIGDSKFFDNGTSIGLGTAAPSSYTQFHIDGITQTSGSAANYCTYTRNKGNVANRLVASPKTYSSYLSCWSNNSSSISVYGNLDSLSRLTANSGYTATGAGGFFNINLYDPIPSSGYTGTYWIAGVYGSLSGSMTTYPTTGAVAAVLGRDLVSSANSYAGYFEGKGYFSGNVGIGTLTPGSSLDVKGTLRLSGSTSGYVGFAPAAAAGSTTYTLPSADGSSGQVLQTNGSGVLSWANATSGTAWQLTGNAGLTDGTHFLGTTAAAGDKPLNFRVNNEKAGRISNTGETFIGYQAGNSNTSFNSTAMGYQALFSNTSSQYQTAVGYQALYSNTTGSGGTALGFNALYANTTGDGNIALGHQALYSNTSGSYNTAAGLNALYSNTDDSYNTAFGYSALYSSTEKNNTAMGFKASYYNGSGSENTAVGYQALYNNIVSYNTAIGHRAGYSNSNDTMCTFVGAYADANGNYQNASAIGYAAIVSNRNKICVGNTNVEWVGGQVTWSTYSDGRFKFNIQENVKGLEFIKRLRPVTYQMNTQDIDNFITQNMPDSVKFIHQQMDFEHSTSKIHSGFIAQEVEQALIDCNFHTSIVSVPGNSTDPYSLAYAEFVVPLVKAVQELSRVQDSLKTVIANLNVSGNNKQNNSSIYETENQILDVKLMLPDAPTMSDAVPNPNSGFAQVNYFLPENTGLAQIIFNDMLGRVLREMPLQPGYGILNIDTQDLPAGAYTYSFVIDGKIIETKKMIRGK